MKKHKTKDVIKGWVIDNEGDIHVPFEVDGKITGSAKKLTKKIFAEIAKENDILDFDFKNNIVESDSRANGWRTIIWNFNDGGQGSDQPLIIVMQQDVDWKL